MTDDIDAILSAAIAIVEPSPSWGRVDDPIRVSLMDDGRIALSRPYREREPAGAIRSEVIYVEQAPDDLAPWTPDGMTPIAAGLRAKLAAAIGRLRGAHTVTSDA